MTAAPALIEIKHGNMSLHYKILPLAIAESFSGNKFRFTGRLPLG